MFRILVGFFIFMGAQVHADSQFIVWNIGQGQWTTEVHKDYCLHFDLGGEVDVSRLARPLCDHRPNFLFLSHWDMDHIGFAAHFAALIQTACLVRLPVGPSPSFHKMEMIKKIPLCQSEDLKIPNSTTRWIYNPSVAPHMSSNDLSRVIFSKAFQILIPGDSTKKEEKRWASDAPTSTFGLVLGHHGSRTSTSPRLLAQLPHLQWAVSSARKKRYGHPHKEVVELLEKEKVPLLKTEDWGHLHFLRSGD